MLIALAKRSPAYRAIRPRVVNPCPSDGWSEDGLAYVVFDLQPWPEEPLDGECWAPQVVFVVAEASGDLLAARMVEPDGSTQEARVCDLLVLASA